LISSIHVAAEGELLEAAMYYRTHGGEQLAANLLDDFERACALLHSFPGIGASWGTRARILPLEHFPYCIVYHFNSDQLRIVAFAHQRRKQGFWRWRV
jgi:plasmid stabilization system protein ParE